MMGDYDYRAWMTPNGDFAGRIEINTKVPDGLALAPSGGGWGLRWTGAEWLDDPESEARAEAFVSGEALPVPDECSAFQGRAALGPERVAQIESILPQLDKLMPGMSARDVWTAQQAWVHSTSWKRLGGMVNTLRALVGMSEAERDDLFRLAVTIEV